MTSGSGAGLQPRSDRDGMVATAYSQTSPWRDGLHVNGISPSGLVAVTSRPSCISHGVRAAWGVLTPIPARDADEPSSPPPLQARAARMIPRPLQIAGVRMWGPQGKDR